LDFRLNPNSPGTAPNKDDTVVVYIKGHGLALDVSDQSPANATTVGSNSDNIRPILIKSLSETDLARSWYTDDDLVIDVGQMLQALAAVPDIRKLVIFDTVHLNYDPRLGTLVNAFPSVVKRIVDQLPSRASLWVLVGQNDGEIAVSLPEGG